MAKNTKYVMGIDVGTGGARAGIFDLQGNAVTFAGKQIKLSTPHSGWAEQEPAEWWSAVCEACKTAIQKSAVPKEDIIGLGLDATCCTVVATDKEVNPLRPAIMWMDVRSAEQAGRISKTKHEALKYNGYGEVSPEFFPCKALWLKENERELYDSAAYFMECTEWLQYKLTGRLAMSINTVTMRWYYDNTKGGWSKSFYDAIGLEDVLQKIPADVLPIGDTLGGLSAEAARATGLEPGIPVGVGISDAHAGLVGLNVVNAGKTALVTGSSHLLLGLMKEEVHGKGFLGTYPDAYINGLHLIEGGQTSTGSILNWFMKYYGSYYDAGGDKYAVFEAKAGEVPVGSEGLILLDYFQGNRTPWTDGDVRGMFYGLSLKHRPEHLYRAIMEGICYGTEVVMQKYKGVGYEPDGLYISGGAANSRLWMQIHSDVCNLPIYIPRETEAPCLGSAILGAVASGEYDAIESAAESMVHFSDTIEPNKERHEEYSFYLQKYAELYPLLREWMHGVTKHDKY